MIHDIQEHLHHLPNTKNLKPNSQSLERCEKYVHTVVLILGEYLSSLSRSYGDDIKLSPRAHIMIARLSGEYVILKGLLISYSMGTIGIPLIVRQIERMNIIADSLKKSLHN